MALVNGPLFSLGASGKLANSLVYSKWKGRNYVREYVIPANPQSLAQSFQRGALTALAKWWEAIKLDPDFPASWNSLAAAGNYSAFNAYCKYNLDRETDNQAPLGALTGGDGGAGLVSGVTATSPEPGRIVAVATHDDEGDGNELIILTLGTAGGANTTANDYRRIFAGAPNPSPALTITGEVRNVPPGTYFVGSRVVNTDGSVSAIVYTASGVVVS